jgi:hypothetical protein
VVLEQAVAEGLAQLGGGFDQAGVALPGLRSSSFFFFFSGRPFFGLAASSSSRFAVAFAPVVDRRFSKRRGPGETGFSKRASPNLLVEHGADVFVAGGEAQRLDAPCA